MICNGSYSFVLFGKVRLPKCLLLPQVFIFFLDLLPVQLLWGGSLLFDLLLLYQGSVSQKVGISDLVHDQKTPDVDRDDFFLANDQQFELVDRLDVHHFRLNLDFVHSFVFRLYQDWTASEANKHVVKVQGIVPLETLINQFMAFVRRDLFLDDESFLRRVGLGAVKNFDGLYFVRLNLQSQVQCVDLRLHVGWLIGGLRLWTGCFIKPVKE
jgi:hypothetical protein